MPTAIEWCDETFNPWWGCEKISPGCAHCYAESVSNHRAGKGNWGAGHGFRFFGDKHWAEPLKWARNLPVKLGRRPRVFCASMADVFEDRPELHEHRGRLLDLIDATPELDWLVLTKRPEYALRLLRFIYFATAPGLIGGRWNPLPPNLWLGVSIENARYTYRADILREIPAAVRFISAEPLLGSLYDGGLPCSCGGLVRSTASGLAECVICGARRGGRAPLDLTGIDWVITGGESGPKARPFHLEHAREIQRAAWSMRHHERPALFVKQLGAKPMDHHHGELAHYDVPLHLRDRKGGDMAEWPPDLRIREFPRSAS